MFYNGEKTIIYLIMGLIEDVREFLSTRSVVDCSIVVSVSGGVDSMALLHLLYELKDEFDMRLSVAHLDHGIRGESSEKDAEFVREVAGKLGLPSTVEKRDVKGITDGGSSLEEAARKVRYEFLEDVRDKQAADYVALGHNRDDQVETVLMHLIQGAGLRGLSGMDPVREFYVRPLLNNSREEIYSYADASGLEYRKDETNQDTDYLRNRIRHELLPELEENYNPRIREKINELSTLAGEAHSFIQERATGVMEELELEREDGEIRFQREGVQQLHPYLKKVAIRQLVLEARGSLKDVTSSHVEKIIDQLEKNPSRAQLDLPGLTFILRGETGRFLEEPGESPDNSNVEFNYEIEPGEALELEEAGMEVMLKPTTGQDIPNPGDFSADSLTEVVDWSKVEWPIHVRNRKPGDRFVPLGMDGEKKLKDFFIDEKVPREERNCVPLVCDQNGVIWVVGYRIDEGYKINHTTEKGLIMKASRL